MRRLTSTMVLCSSIRTSAASISIWPIYDFLIPCLAGSTISHRCLSTSRISHSVQYGSRQKVAPPRSLREPKSVSEAASKSSLTQAQRDFLASALRVNQAGELAATLIYAAQTPVVVASHPHLRPLMKHMYDQEAGHFSTFNALIAKHRVRPTAMYPLWTIAASALGWGTAIMGREAAMACTEAVETEIGTHYNDQVRCLLDMAEKMEERGEELGTDLKEMIATTRRIRDEELEHLDHAVGNDAKKAVPYELLTNFIRAGCRAAIRASERV